MSQGSDARCRRSREATTQHCRMAAGGDYRGHQRHWPVILPPHFMMVRLARIPGYAFWSRAQTSLEASHISNISKIQRVLLSAILLLLPVLPARAQGNAYPSGDQEGVSRRMAPVGVGTTTEVTTRSSGPDRRAPPSGVPAPPDQGTNSTMSGGAINQGLGNRPGDQSREATDQKPKVNTNAASGKNAQCRSLPNLNDQVACLQGYAQVLTLSRKPAQ
jgi:hypothetical protein